MENKRSLNFGIHEHSLETNEGENLPHWNCKNAIYHVSFRLADSVPKNKRDEWLNERNEIEEKISNFQGEISDKLLKELQYLYSDRIEKYLDSGYGECFLANPKIADIVSSAIQHFEGKRYILHSWCIMPNHVHIIVEPLEADLKSLSKIVHSWKSYIAHEANKSLNRSGDFWQHDYFNHIIRSYQSYLYQMKYIWDNPENAGLKNWKNRWKLELNS